jgi:carboxyl-terminal processing protease
MNRIKTISVAATLLLVPAGCDSIFLPEPAADPEAVFENLWTTFDQEFANFADRGVDWNAMYARHRPRVGPTTTDAELFQVLSDLMLPLNDSHVSLTAPNQQTFLSNEHDRARTGSEVFRIDLIRDRYLEPGFGAGHHDAYVYGRIRGQAIGYFYVRAIDAEFQKLERLLDEHPELGGYIIDLRQNRGGNHTFAFTSLGRFTDQTRYVFRSRTKNGPGPNDYTPWHEWHLRPTGRHVDKPIVVLTDRRTPSAAERAVMALRTLPRVTVMGDTTNGSISTKIARELSNGWYYSLTPQQVEMFDGRSYEGRGLAPDLVVRNDVAEIRAGVDRLMEAAIEWLR